MSIVCRWVLAAITILASSCSRESSAPTAPDAEVGIELGGPIHRVSGVYWPAGDAVETLAIEKPRTIRVRFPSGRDWTCRSKITFLSQANETVGRVEVAPLDEVSEFAGTVAALTKILDELGVAAESPARERVAEWREAPPAWEPSATQTLTLPLEQGVELLAEIKTAREENRWFLLCSFQAGEKGTPQ